MDALSDVLRVVHLTGGVFLHAEFSAPWCIASHITPELCQPVLGPVSQVILYHYVIEGEFRLRVEGENTEPPYPKDRRSRDAAAQRSAFDGQ